MSIITKKAIASALKKLMETKPFEKITVKDIVTECQINRGTFYYYFQDIYELLGFIYKTEAIDKIEEYRTYETWQQGYLMIFEFIKSNRKFCINTLNSLGRKHLNRFLLDITYSLLEDIIDEIIKTNKIDSEDEDFIISVYSFVLIGFIISWMDTGMKQDPKEIVEKLSILMEGTLKRSLDKYLK